MLITLELEDRTSKILVAPYWNLNYVTVEEYKKSYNILVAPYWNLNF